MALVPVKVKARLQKESRLLKKVQINAKDRDVNEADTSITRYLMALE